MNDFADLYDALDSTTKTTKKVDALVSFFQIADDMEKMYAIALLTGNKPKRPIRTTLLRMWTAEFSHIPLWFFEESYYVVGDLGETITHIVSNPKNTQEKGFTLQSLFELMHRIRTLSEEEQRTLLFEYWNLLGGTHLYLFNKMLTGSLRIGVSKNLVIKAIGRYLERDEKHIAHQMMGNWSPENDNFNKLFADSQEIAHHVPYPFYLAYPLEQNPEELGTIDDWIIEKKLDGIRGQIIRRNQDLFIWSRGEDLLTDKFPEFEILRDILPDGIVLDGEIIPWKDNAPLSFGVMQTRIGRKNLSKKILQDAPLIMVCYDILEYKGEDLRSRPLSERKQLLEKLLEEYPSGILLYSESLHFKNWKEAEVFRAKARLHQCEGLMLKHKDSIYDVGRRRGGWWKWKTEPLTIDAVMIYAQSGHGRRANLFTDYTFAVWDGALLVPFAKAYSGLTDKEIGTLDKWIKQNTIEKFGPVRSVKPFHVFEIAFEGINKSTRHKSGVALRFPRILRWRLDKDVKDANTKEDLLQILKQYGV